MASQLASDANRSLFEKLVGIEIKEYIIGLSIGLAFLSLFLTINSDIFAQDDEPIAAFIVKPIKRLLPSNPPAINLSALLTPKPSKTANEQSGGVAKKDETRLYVFALDVSKSMKARPVHKEEMEQYLQDIKNPPNNSDESPTAFSCLPQNKPLYNTFDIAKAELCRFLYSVPNDSHVALYTFGSTVQRLAPGRGTDDIYMTFKPTEGGGHTRKQVLELIPSLEADQDKTDFEGLLHELYFKYKKELSRRAEVHVVLISDFIHDLGGGSQEGHTKSSKIDVEQLTWESIYRSSSVKIANLLRDMALENTTFHLAEIEGSRRVMCAILPIVDGTLEMFRYRETHLIASQIGKEFDFLRAYQESEIPLIFYYSNVNAKTLETKIRIDRTEYTHSSVRFALATEATARQFLPLKIEVNSGSDPKDNTTHVLRLDTGGYNTKINHQDDSLTLRPLSILEPREAASYRLLISWVDPDDPVGAGPRTKTMTVPIIFYQQLTKLSAGSILLSEIFVLLSFLGLVIKWLRGILDKRLIKTADPKVMAMAAGAGASIPVPQGTEPLGASPSLSGHSADKK